ncbi:hypothetical protein WJX77_001132 [Trebouxia sp. C0004]
MTTRTLTVLSTSTNRHSGCVPHIRSVFSGDLVGTTRRQAFSSGTRALRIMAMYDAAAHIVHDDGQFPNCSIQKLPVLIYKSAFDASGNPSELANKIEETFSNNGFPPQWRFGLYEYPHYHSTSHEILGVFKGSARVRLGGSKKGIEEEVRAGDVIVIPAGVAHESLQSKGGFEMVGAYPAGCSWDMNYGKGQEEKQKSEANIKKVGVPTKDPVYGSKGPVLEHWQKR